MFCTRCGQQAGSADQFCASCGTVLAANSPRSPNVAPASAGQQWTLPNTPPPISSPDPRPQTGGVALGVAALVVGILGLIFALYDYGLISGGDYDYIYSSEITILMVMATIAVVLGGMAKRRGSGLGQSALIVGVIIWLVTLYLRQFAG